MSSILGGGVVQKEEKYGPTSFASQGEYNKRN